MGPAALPLFMVIVHLHAGQLPVSGGAFGPLDETNDSCARRAASYAAQYESHWHDPRQAATYLAIDPRSGPTSMRFVCRRLAEKPAPGALWVDEAVPLLFPDRLR